MITTFVLFLKRVLFNEKFALLNELLFISFFSLLGPKMEELILIILILMNINNYTIFC